MANPLLREPLKPEHIKPRLLGHWGTSPGLAFVYAHVSRLIKHTGQDCLYITGPGHGGPALVGASYLEGTYTDAFPHITQDNDGLLKFFRQFSAPGGIPSHVSVTTPGSIHEGGELGYALIHAFGSVFDNPDLLVVAVVGDGEAETGALATSWHSNKFLNPVRDGAVLPILHLNGYKIAGPTVLARIPPAELDALFAAAAAAPVAMPADRHAASTSRLDGTASGSSGAAVGADRSGRRGRIRCTAAPGISRTATASSRIGTALIAVPAR